MISRTLMRLAALALAAWMPLQALAADPASPAAVRVHPGKAAFPELFLADTKAAGQRAIDLLGTALPSVAAYYGRSAEEFRLLMLRDKHLRLDQRGRLFIEDALEAPLPDLAPAERSVLDGTLLPLDQTFLLHSRPAAKRTIYLNFKGATLSGTAWNSAGTTITASAFDLDGVPGSFSTTELQRIQGIWQRVAEDFAPFDVDVTTELPPADRLTRSSSADQIFGTTVVITKTAGVYSCSCGGVAYVGVFDDVGEYYKPALVFYDALASGNEKYVADAISHEAGHNMGLLHDGVAGSAYYSGHGTGATGWAPIMGNGYGKSLVQWSKGEYSTATNTQDDYTVMESNGLPIRLDDYGDTIATATALTGTTSGGVRSHAMQGVIERPGDVDMFSFVSAAGSVTITLTPAAREPNLDAQIDLRDSTGALLGSDNPADALNASLTVTVPRSGTYYVSVQGVGKGDPLTSGYSNYGSLGNYLLAVTAPASGALPPVAAVSATPTSGTAPLAVSLSGAASSDPDGTISSYAWSFGDGTTGSGPSVSHTYATAGSFTALLTVTDNTGLQSTKSVTITATAANVAPAAAVTATPISGTAPLTVTLSGTGSTDTDGTITSYAWAYGDGTTGSGVTTSHVYANPGTYTAVLTVTDNGGLTATRSVVITVAAPNKAPTVSLTAPSAGAGYTAPATIALTATAADSDGSVAKVEFFAGATKLGEALAAPYALSWSSVATGTYVLTAVATDDKGAKTTSASVTVTVASASSASVNVAAAANGGVATASSTYSANYPASSVIDGDRRSNRWGSGGGWNNARANFYPEWVEVRFSSTRSIDRINVVTLADNFATAPEPTPTTTFTAYGITAYTVQYYTGTAWVTVPSGNVTGNNLVLRSFTFPAVSTDRIRVQVNAALQSYSRIVEIEAWSAPAVVPVNAASAANGAVATASSTYSANYPVSSVIDGNRRGNLWGSGGGWNNARANFYPEWVEVRFSSTRSIDRIEVFTLADSYTTADPTPTMTFTAYGITAYNVQYYNGTAWVTVPGGSVTGNNLVWRTFSFPAVSTDRIRVQVNAALQMYSRIVEIEAWSTGP